MLVTFATLDFAPKPGIFSHTTPVRPARDSAPGRTPRARVDGVGDGPRRPAPRPGGHLVTVLIRYRTAFSYRDSKRYHSIYCKRSGTVSEVRRTRCAGLNRQRTRGAGWRMGSKPAPKANAKSREGHTILAEAAPREHVLPWLPPRPHPSRPDVVTE